MHFLFDILMRLCEKKRAEIAKIKKLQKKLKNVLTLNTKFDILISRCVRKALFLTKLYNLMSNI